MYLELYRDRVEVFKEYGLDPNYSENMFMLYNYLQQISCTILFSGNRGRRLKTDSEGKGTYSFGVNYAWLDIDGEKISVKSAADFGLIMEHAKKLPSCIHAVFAADYDIMGNQPSLVLVDDPDGNTHVMRAKRCLFVPPIEFFSAWDGEIPAEIVIGSYWQEDDLTNHFSCSKRGETEVHTDMENFSEGLGKVGSAKNWHAELSVLGISFSRAAAGDRYEEIRQKFSGFNARYCDYDVWEDQVEEDGDLIEGSAATGAKLTAETLPMFLKELEELSRLIGEAAPGGTLTLGGHIFSEDPEHPLDVIRVETDDNGAFRCFSASL